MPASVVVVLLESGGALTSSEAWPIILRIQMSIYKHILITNQPTTAIYRIKRQLHAKCTILRTAPSHVPLGKALSSTTFDPPHTINKKKGIQGVYEAFLLISLLILA